MLSLYEILKASKTGIAPDMWTALAGKNWGGADSGHEIKELTGIPPLSFTADGTPLLDYLISGNMSQTGTPTPTTPIQPQECGERTGNLFPLDANKLHVGRIENDGTIDYEVGTITISTDSVSYQANTAWRGFYTDFIPVTGVVQLTVSPNVSSSISIACNCYDGSGTFLGEATSTSTSTAKIFTLLQGTVKVRISFTSSNTSYTITQPMLNTGSTALPYEPWGIKIPISSANTTTPVYLGEVETTRKIKKLVLTGNESGDFNIDITNHIFALRGIFNSEPELLQVGGVCTHYKYNNAVSSLIANMQNGDFVLNKIVNDYSFTIKDNSFNTASKFLTYLQQQYAAGTPVCVWYVLANETTGIVNEPLRKIGDYADTVSMEQAGVQIPTIKGNTVVDVDTTLKPSEMYIKYQG